MGVQTAATSPASLYQNVTEVTTPGSQYQISGWIKTSNVTGNAAIALDYVGPGGVPITDGGVEQIGDVIATQDWTFFQSIIFTLQDMPSDAAALWFSLDFNGGTGTAWWDNVSLSIMTVGPTSAVISTIPMDSTPGAVALNPTTDLIYAADITDNNVWVIDGSTNDVIAKVAVGNTPVGVAVNPSTNLIYVVNYRNSTISVINGSSNTVTTTFGIGVLPGGYINSIAVNPITNLIYAATNNGVVVIAGSTDGTTNSVMATVDTGSYPYFVAVNPVTNLIYVTNWDSANTTLNDVSVIDGSTNTVIATVTAGQNPRSVAVDPNTNQIYVANSSDNDVSVIDGSTNTVTATVNTGPAPGDEYQAYVAVNPSTNRIYVTNDNIIDINNVLYTEYFLAEIDGFTNTVTDIQDLGISEAGQIIYVCGNNSSSLIYVANILANEISVMQDSIASPVPTIVTSPMIAAGGDFAVGLKSEGSVVAAGDNRDGQCGITSWNGITQVATGGDFTVGLESTGDVVAQGEENSNIKSVLSSGASPWTGISQLAAGEDFVIGLKSNGTVVAAGDDSSGQVSGVTAWNSINGVTITQVAAGQDFAVGLESNGNVVVDGNDSNILSGVSSWSGITQVAAGGDFTVGLELNGEVVATGDNTYCQCDVSNWDLGNENVTSIINGAASVVQNDGVAVNISASNASNGTGVAVASTESGNMLPAGAGVIQLYGSQYYDVKVFSSSGLGDNAVAEVSITNTTGSDLPSDSTMQYWDNGEWNTASNISISGSTITGDIPVSALGGTPFVIGAHHLISITVKPNPPTDLKVGSTEQFTALGKYSDGSQLDVTSQVTWTSSDTTKATITSTGGLASGVAAGTTNITATMNGINSQQVILTVKVAATPTSSTITSSVNPSVFGQSVTFTATVSAVSPGVGTPTGTVQFIDGANNLGSAITLSGGEATYSTSSLSMGSHSITAVYNGVTNFTPSTSSALTQVINQASTSTSIGSSATPSVFGQSVNFVATVSAAAPGAGTLTGAVQFVLDGNNFGSPVSLAGGSATSNVISTLSVGTHKVSAVYSGDTNFTTSTGTLSGGQVVNKATPSTVGANVTATYSGSNQTITLAATVTAIGETVNEGIITFTVQDKNNTVIGKPVTSGTVSGGSANANFTIPGGTPALTYTITTAYGGGPDFVASSDNTKTLTVNKAADQTFVLSVPNPSVYGAQVTFTALVIPSSINPTNIITNNNGSTVLNTSSLTTILGNYIPTGSITFMDGLTQLGTVNLSKLGFVTFTTSSLVSGNDTITAVYSGDNNYLPSTSSTLTQKVNKANTTTNLTSSANPSNSGKPITFTASIFPVGATGTITFYDGSTKLGSGTVVSGKATFTATSLTKGTHSITAVYVGDNNYNGSTSSVLSQKVN
jgi:YVTN family beta-propeller protein